MGYREGRVEFGEFNPLQHDFKAQFNATPSGLTLNSMALTSTSFQITANAHLQDYSNPSVDGSYQAVVSGGGLGKLLKNNLLPKGEVNTKGTLYYRNDPQQPALNNLSIEGQLNSPVLAIDLPEARANLRSLRGEYRLNKGTFEVRNVQAEVLGGQMTANLTMHHLADKLEAKVEGTVRGVSLTSANAALRTKPVEHVELTGRLDGTVSASWHGSMQALQVRSDATIAAQTPVNQGKASGTRSIPLDGALHLAYDGSSNIVTLQQTFVRTPHVTLRLNGALGTHSSLGIQAQTDDLHEVDLLALAVRTRGTDHRQPVSTAPELLGLGGSAAFNGRLQGTKKTLA